MLVQGVAFVAGDGLLQFLDVGIEKFFHAATVQADQVVVVHAFIQLVDGLVGRKAVAPQQSGLLELAQHAVNGG